MEKNLQKGLRMNNISGKTGRRNRRSLRNKVDIKNPFLSKKNAGF
jgi:hypothetical protein